MTAMDTSMEDFNVQGRPLQWKFVSSARPDLNGGRTTHTNNNRSLA
jgi:hypothetical protein